MRKRRGPWLGGLIVALVGAVWMIGQVLGAMVGLVSGLLTVAPADTPTVSAPITRVESVTDAPR